MPRKNGHPASPAKLRKFEPTREPSVPPPSPVEWGVSWEAEVNGAKARCCAVVTARTAFAAFEAVTALLGGKGFGEVNVSQVGEAS